MSNKNINGKTVIVLANDAVFTPSWKPYNPCVESRMCLWCRSGTGKVLVDGRSFDLEAYDYLLLPWEHSIRYTPDKENPFVLAGIHIIPWHDLNVPVDWGVVSHNTKHIQDETAPRQDRPLEGLDGIQRLRLFDGHALMQLSEYIVQSFKSSKDRGHLEMCAEILVNEVQRTLAMCPEQSDQIRQLRRFIEQNVNIPLSVIDLANEVGRSPSQVNRMCKAHLNVSPGKWIVTIKIERACQALRSTRRSIAEVGRQAGYHDQFHFSRVFKQHMGLSPLKYRQRQQLI